MAANKRPRLVSMVSMTDQLIEITIEFLSYHTNDPDQLVLSITREQALRKLQSRLHAEYEAEDCDRRLVMTFIIIITETVVGYTLENLSDSNSYKFCRGWRRLFSTKKKPSSVASFYCAPA